MRRARSPERHRWPPRPPQVRLAVDEQFQTLPHGLVIFHQEYAQPLVHLHLIRSSLVRKRGSSTLEWCAQRYRRHSSGVRTSAVYGATVWDSALEHADVVSDEATTRVARSDVQTRSSAWPSRPSRSCVPDVWIRDGLITSWNSGAERLLGHPPRTHGRHPRGRRFLSANVRGAGVGMADLGDAERQGVDLDIAMAHA